MSVRVFSLLLDCILFISCKRLVDSKYSRRSKDLLKEFHHFFICCSHPWLIKIIFQSSNCMDPMLLAIILFLSIVVRQICIFKEDWDITCTNVKEYFDNILTVHLGKVICAPLACCANLPDMHPVPLFISRMNLRTYPSNFETFLQGLVHKRYKSNVCDSISSTLINQTRHHV